MTLPHAACGPARRSVVRVAAALALATAMPWAQAQAQAYPDRPVWIVVPFAPGGAVDIVARTLATDLAKSLGQPVNVENRTGAGGNIAAAHVARSRPDGHTLMIGGGANTVARQVFANLQYDPEKDLTPIAMIGAAPSVLLVSPGLPVKDVAGLVALAKSKPGTLTIGHGGAGTTSEHLAGEMFKSQAGVQMTTVAYKGGPAAMNDLIGGQITVVFTNILNALPHLQSGRLRALAVTGAQRVPSLPAVPTMKESGFPDFEVAVWWGLMGPANLPPTVVDRLGRAVGAALVDGAIKARLEALSAQPLAMSPAQFADFYAAESRKWAEVARRAGLKPE